ncbi:MAG: hypothetical protein A2W03_16545 [Candidatus Aminicenantes bacterium RBG_16_63_16]|nr:MAG: hypothetical protein A2W03_16545 [Candidatus Aminicenantes bacterium RBG_16_63_16]
MQKTARWTVIALFLVCPLAPQEQPAASSPAVAVPVRVMDGDRFVDDLTLGDFEILENLVPQKIQALYLVGKSAILRREALQEQSPDVSRNFYLLFQMTDYNPKLAELVDYLIKDVLSPTDSLVLQTPLKTYALSAQALARKPREAIAQDMNSLLKKDIKTGSAEYNSLVKDLRRMVINISGANPSADIESDVSLSAVPQLEFMLNRYKETQQRVEESRLIDEKKILSFAAALKKVAGQKHVFFIYQREFRPQVAPAVMNTMLASYQDQPNVMSDLQDLFQEYRRDLSLDADRLGRTFSDADAVFHLIFMNKEPERVSGIVLVEQSEDIFRAFSETAKGTGGIVDSSQNPVAGFKHAMAMSEAYYILYYFPEGGPRDTRFKTITVRLKNRTYSLLHRKGYFVN